MSNNTTVSVNVKYFSLVILIAQTTSLVLVLRYSQTHSVEGTKYLSSTAVVLAEIIKFITCLIVLLWKNSWQVTDFCQQLSVEIFNKPCDTLKVGVPALLYVVQNNLLFLALGLLDAATYQVTYQLKILTTAFFSVTMLNKKINNLKWGALMLLTFGVVLIQFPSDFQKSKKLSNNSNKLIGLVFVICSCFSSGFAGVYFEKILKSSPVSLWVRNLQLAFFSVFGGLFMVYTYDSAAVFKDGFFQGYNSTIWVVIVLQAYGGLVIALVVKYADNILKGFAVSLSIIFSSIISWWFMDDFEPTIMFLTGATIVVISTFLYGYEPEKFITKYMT